jgi:SAM-dependent methyltransferase
MRARHRLLGAVVTQFVRPRGLVGWVAGWEMALRPSNRKRNRWVVALLDLQPQDHVLEIGFGPGLAIRELARRATDGFVLGIDHSEVMVRRAAVRNRAAVEQGRVELRLGSALDVRDFSEMFDKALAVNNFGMWPRGAAHRSSRSAAAGRSSGDCLATALSRCVRRDNRTRWSGDGGAAPRRRLHQHPAGDAEAATSGGLRPSRSSPK